MALKAFLESPTDGENIASGGGADSQSAQTDNSSTDTSSAGPGTPASDSSQGDSGAVEVGKEAAKDEKPKSALDAVLKALDKTKPGDGTAAAPKQGDAALDGKTVEAPVSEEEHKAAGEGEKDWISRDEYAKLSPVVRRRISNLTSQRNEARDTMKTLEPRAKARDDLVSFCTQNRVTPEDLSYGLEVLALVRKDPAKAYERLMPLVRDLQAHVGEILPADLEKEVQAGTLSEERAKELARTRREKAVLEQRTNETTEEQRREQAERTVRDGHEKITSSIRTWEDGWKAKDPDYQKKAERVFERMVVLMQGKELTPETAVTIAEQAKKDVEKWFADVLPKPREIKPGPSGGANVTTVKKPTSALEAARLAVAR